MDFSSFNDVTEDDLYYTGETDYRELSIDPLHQDLGEISRDEFSRLEVKDAEDVFDPSQVTYRSIALDSEHADLLSDPSFLKESVEVSTVGSSLIERPGFPLTSAIKPPSLKRTNLIVNDSKPLPTEPGYPLGRISPSFTDLTPPKLPGFPFTLETNCFSRFSGSPDTIASTIDRTLAKYDSQIQFILEKCKWKGMYSSGSKEPVKFVVHLFSQDAEYIVEMQRRKGNFQVFRQVYEHLMNAIDKALATEACGPMTADLGELPSSSELDVHVPVLPKFPFQLETLCHFPVSGKQQDIVNDVSKVLEGYDRNSIDIKFSPSKCKWKIALYLHTAFVKFVIRIFRNGDEFIVELQRRQGDSWAFRKIYNDLAATVGSQRNKNNNTPPYPLADINRSIAHDGDALKEIQKLLISVYSPKIDVKVKAAETILALSRSDDFRKLISEYSDSHYQITKLVEEPDISEIILLSIQSLLECDKFKAGFLDARNFNFLIDSLSSVLQSSVQSELVWEMCASVVSCLPPVESSRLSEEMIPVLRTFSDLLKSKLGQTNVSSRGRERGYDIVSSHLNNLIVSVR